MRVDLKLVNPSRRVVEISFTNDARHAAFLAKPRTFAVAPDGNYFEIDPRVAYLGIVTKRAPYTQHELLRLDAGASVTYALDLNELYDLGDTRDDRRIRYCAAQPLDGSAKMTLLHSQWVALT
jgi:hypothetical protein